MKRTSIGMIGALVISAVILLTAIIIASAPYLAIIIVLTVCIRWIELEDPDDEEEDSK